MKKADTKRKNQMLKPSRRLVRDGCLFCKDGMVPSYKEYQSLEKFLTERKKIVSRFRSGVCAKHQRQLAREVKHARLLALLPLSIKVG